MKLYWPLNQSLEEALQQVTEQPIHRPFDEEVLTFMHRLSQRFLRLREFPEIVALGYWLRKANIERLRRAFDQETEGRIVRARGTVFHIAPSNVDTIFVYSWMLSLLAGNRNIIRISSKAEANTLLTIILEELVQFETVARQTIICTYGHEENATVVLSQLCHTRVIWGGDATIQAIRQVPLAPLANELAFPDRFSLAVLQAEKVNELDERQLGQLVEQFYNDAFWFDQLACSSPRLIVWVGQSVSRFWQALETKVQQKQYKLQAATQVLKYATSLQLTTEEAVQCVRSTAYFSKISLNDVSKAVREQHCGGGLFYEQELASLEDVATIVMDKDQTLSYFGFEVSELTMMAEMILTRGIDRIVPIGQALNFDSAWDGQNFLTSFTREVVIK